MSFKTFAGLVCLILSLPCLAIAENNVKNSYWHNYTVSGYIDTSYNYLLRNHQFISGINDRVNDLAQNGFTLQQAAITLSKQPSQGLGGLLNVLVGRDAYSNVIYGWNPYYGSQTLGLVAPEAYLQYKTGPFTVMGGLFETLIGAESYNSSIDANFSRSILDGYAEPGVLVGMRGLYMVNKKLNLNLGFNNGWGGIRAIGQQFIIEMGATYTHNAFLSLYLQGLTGEARLLKNVTAGPKGRRHMLNLIAILNATKCLTLTVSGDYALQSKALTPEGDTEQAIWRGITGYVNYQLNDKWRTALRGEIYEDPNGYTTGVRQNWQELTLTLAYIPIKSVELRAETRHDFSNVNAFMNATEFGTSNNQQSYALEALYIF